MCLQVGPLVETATAHGTLVRRLLHVQNLVHGQGARLAEALAALGALEWLLFRVDVSEGGRGTLISNYNRSLAGLQVREC